MKQFEQVLHPFERSFALFDRDGRLLEWDDGFVEEFGAAQALIGLGASLRALIAAVYGGDQDALADLAARSQFDPARSWTDRDAIAAAVPRVYDIRSTERGILRILEQPTQSGGLMRLVRNVTAERRANATFAAAQEEWALDGDPMREAETTMRISGQGVIEYSAPAADIKAVWGVPEADGMAELLSSMHLTAEERLDHQAKVAHVARTRAPDAFEFRVRGGDGRLRWIRTALSGSEEEDGYSVITMRHRDVTVEKRAEDRLQLLQSAVTHATDSIQIVHTGPDNISTTVYANPAFELTTGWPADELIGRSVALMAGWGQTCWDRLLAMVEGGDESAIEVQVPRRDGVAIWLEVGAKVVERRLDGSIRWAAVSRNIDERRRIQADLYRARDEAEAANRAKSEFLANMSHEIRTPMNGVIGMNALLLRGTLTEDQRKFADAVKISADSLLNIINDILDVSKLEAGKVELESIDFSLETVVEDAVELLSAKAVEKGLEIACYLDDGARQPLRGDPTRLRQIVLNLLSNALKFTDHGYVSLEARVQPNTDGTQLLRLEVSDTGIGLSPQAKAKLFTKFQQADGSITRRFGGTGLGLSICRQLVELMGGRIGVENRPGGGAAFWVEATLQPALAAPAIIQRNSSLVGVRILVVDDIEMNRSIFARQLESDGAVVDEVDGGQACLDAVDRAEAEGRAYHLILMDHMMPGMAGDEAAERIRARGGPNQPKLVLASSIGAPHSTDRAAFAGFDAFLTKPVRHQHLLDCLGDLIAPAPAKAAAPPGKQPPREPESLAQGHVLLAEDHTINTLLAKTLLEAAGYAVCCVANGMEAIQACRERPFDLILMDVQMPVMDGLEATRRIRALAPPASVAPIVAMTASAMNSDREACLAAGMVDFVSKPFEPDNFLTVVSRWMVDHPGSKIARPKSGHPTRVTGSRRTER